MARREKAPPIKGLIPPAITPFLADGGIDRLAIRALADFWAPRVDALFICGTYGSGPMSTPEQRCETAELYLEAINGRIPIVVHIGAASTHTAVHLARHAQARGAHAVAAVPPFYYEHSEASIIDYYKRIRDAVDVSFYVYNNPRCAGNHISPQLLARLADEVHVDGVKDSSFDILIFYAMLRAVRIPGFRFVIGTEALILPATVMGVDTCVAGLANALPEEVRDLLRACLEGGHGARAAALQQRVLELREIMKLGQSIPASHAILEMRGVRSGLPQPPYAPLSREASEHIRTLLRQREVAVVS